MAPDRSRRTGLLRKRDFGTGPEADAKYASNLLALLSVTLIISALSGGLLNVSFPVVVRHFDASASEASWLLLGAMLTSTSLIIVFGRLADMLGRRPFFLGGVAVLAATSLLAGLAPNVQALIAIRVVQAVGTAMLLAVMAAILTVSTPPERLSRYMGIYMSALASASLAGPPLGAVLADTLGWRALFLFQAPFAVVALVWAALTLRPMPSTSRGGRLDVPGAIVVMAVLTGVIFALSRLQTRGLTNPLVLTGFAVFVIGLPVFVLLELRTASPLVDVRLFVKRSVAASNGAVFFGNMAGSALVLMGGLYFQAAYANSPLEAAFKILPMPLATTLAGLSMGRISRLGTQHAIATVALVFGGSGIVLLLAAFGLGWSYPVIFVGLFIAGFGGGVFVPANTTAILREVPSDRLGVVNAVRMMLMIAGGLIATALSLTLLTSALPTELRSAVFAGNMSKVSADAVDQLREGYIRAAGVLLALHALGILASYIAHRSYVPPVAESSGKHAAPARVPEPTTAASAL
ncbi:MAG: transporter [Pseudonocardiales bacterium]|nr:transporter [Pseudonocardiales bacterium]